MPSYDIVANYAPGETITLQPRGIYLLLGNQPDSKHEDFVWGIVIIMDGGTPTYHYITELPDNNPTGKAWFYQAQSVTEEWDIRQPKVPTVLFELGAMGDGDFCINYGKLVKTFTDALTDDGGLGLRAGEYLNRRTWVRSVVKKLSEEGAIPMEWRVVQKSGSKAVKHYMKELQKDKKSSDSGLLRIVRGRSE